MQAFKLHLRTTLFLVFANKKKAEWEGWKNLYYLMVKNSIEINYATFYISKVCLFTYCSV